MGLFDGLKTMIDIVKGGIEAYKATEKMDQIAAQLLADNKAACGTRIWRCTRPIRP